MNYNKKVKAYKKELISDGMGGGTEGFILIQENINGATAPSQVRLLDAGGREIVYKILKIFSPVLLEDENLFFETEDGKKYKVSTYTDYGKVVKYECEEYKR